MATKKATPAQLAARKKFAEMVRSGAFKKNISNKRKTSPRKKTVSQKISQLTHEGYPQKQAVAVALSEMRKGKVKRNPTAKTRGKISAVVLMKNPIKKKTVKRNPIDFGGQSGSSGLKATEATLKAKLKRLEDALGTPAWEIMNPNAEGALGLDKSYGGYRLVQLVGSSGERDLSDRLTAKEMMNFLDGANLVARAVKK